MTDQFVAWFRGASPYINAHRGRIIVIHVGGELVEHEGFSHLIHDISLLNSLGIRLVLVHGIRPQVERRTAELGITTRLHKGLRVTGDAELAVVKEAAGAVRVEIEALLSMGLANSPMAGARIRVTSGNFIIARPLGVIDGVDFLHTGEIRRVDVGGIQDQLNQGGVVVVSPIGYSPTGEAFNLSGETVATALSLCLGAAKLMLLGSGEALSNGAGVPLRQLTLEQARTLLETDPPGLGSAERHHLENAVHAGEYGVERVHLLDGRRDGALLKELFTRDGVGTLVSADRYEALRPATIEDIGGLLELLEPLEQDGTLVRRPREKLEQEIDHFVVMERDGTIIGCAARYPSDSPAAQELACLVIHPEYRRSGLGETLLDRVESDAVTAGARRMFVLTTRTAHWFRERGYVPGDVEDLPLERRQGYNRQRSSKVLVKALV